MMIRRAVGLAVLAIPAITGANEAVERLQQNASALLDVIPPAYGCRAELIETIPYRYADELRMLVRLTAKGGQCREAVRMLNYRGKSAALTFIATRKSLAPNDLLAPSRPNRQPRDQRLIHEIDP